MPTKIGAGRAISADDGQAVQPPDRRSGPPAAQGNAIPEGNSRELCELLEGEAYCNKFGFLCETAERFLQVPFSVTRNPVSALIACRRQGLLRSKMDGISVEDADYICMTLIVKPELEN